VLSGGVNGGAGDTLAQLFGAGMAACVKVLRSCATAGAENVQAAVKPEQVNFSRMAAKRDPFAVLPEGQVRLGFQVNDSLSAFVGYDFLYMSNVARPGSQTLNMWSAADPARFKVMQITLERPGDAGQHGQVILSGIAQT
jgi:hypothetical protein